jgi:hypothetical protein
LLYHIHNARVSAHNLGDLKLGEEYEQWRDHVKTTEEGRRLIITHQLLERLSQQDPNTAKTLNEKT